MKKFDRIKTIQLLLLIAITAASLVVILRDSELYALIATNMAARTISVLLWLTLGLSFIFLLYDFNSYADMRRENSELDNAVYSDALTGIANRYSVDAYIGQFHGKQLRRQLLQRLFSVDVTKPGRPPVILAGIDGNAQKPRFFIDDLFALKIIHVLPGFDPGVLGGVLGLAMIGQIQITGSQDRIRIVFDPF